MTLNKLFALLLMPVFARGFSATCGDGESVTFAKWLGVRTERGEREETVFVYAARADEASLAGACTARCRELAHCAAVQVAHARAECTGLARLPTPHHALRLDNDYSLYTKTCMKVPEKCSVRWWMVELTPGYQLLAEGRDIKVLHNVTAEECAKALAVDPLPRPDSVYRSAQWVPADGGGDVDIDADGGGATAGVGGVAGHCALRAGDKYTEPEAFRVAARRSLYLENQCRHDFSAKIDRCSYEEYFNQTLKHVELNVNEVSRDECKTRCEREERFVCRGFSWRAGAARDEGGVGRCALHGEDAAAGGSWLLRRAPSTVYHRRVLCLNISVECTGEDMVVKYWPRGTFRGRVYVAGRGEQCGVEAGSGAGGEAVRLVLPLRGPCDVNFAHAVTRGPGGSFNKTMAYAMVLIQNNPIIQTAGDRWVRVGCSPSSVASAPASSPAIATLAVTVHTARAPVAAGGVAPASAVFAVPPPTPPPLAMYVTRAGNSPEGDALAGAVSLGEPLDLHVETTDENEIEAYHLVASSRLGDSSVLLLDARGCPTGQVDFPAFTRSRGGEGGAGAGVQRLSARFKAFRFPNSHVLRFALMVRSCPGTCQEINCGPGPKSRAARNTNETSIGEENDVGSSEEASVREESGWSGADAGPGYTVAAVCAAAGAAEDAGAVGGARGPLQLELVVGARDLLSADTLVRADHLPKDEAVGGAGSTGAMVCVHELLLVAAALGWLVIQLLLLAGCCLMLKRYRNFAEMASQKDYHSFDNVGFDTVSTHRRVHWPDQNVDILHVN